MKESISLKYFRAAFEKWFRNANLKQFQAGMRLNISQSLVTKLLRGERGLSFAQADQIAQGLNTTVAQMLLEGQKILEGPHEKSEFDNEQRKAIESFKECLRHGGDAAEMLANAAIDLAQKKRAAEDLYAPAAAQKLKQTA
jgi:hypothetical protein